MLHVARLYLPGGVRMHSLTSVSIPRERNQWVEQALSDVIEGAVATVAQVRSLD